MPHVRVATDNSSDLSIYYEDHGTGRPVILIHGYPLSGTSWERQIPPLLAAGLRVITYDRRGFGRSDKPAGPYDYDTFAADLRALVEHLGLNDISLVGFSMGGGEVARYIGRYGSEGVRSVAILSGVPPYLVKAPGNDEGVDPSVFTGIEAAVRADRYAFFSTFFENFFNADKNLPERVSKEVITASWNVATSSSPIADVACVATWGEDFRADVARIDVPTLVMHGDSDRIVPFEAAGKRTAAMVKGSKLVVVEGGPHAINWTHADQVNDELVALLK